MRKFMTIMIVILLSIGVASAQTRVITGKVTDSKGAAVPGATVKTKSGAAVAADENGNFKIKAETGDVLTVTSIDYETSTIKVGSKSSFDIVMTSSENKLAEVVITALGFSTRKDKLASSQSTIKGDAIISSGETSVLQGLAGKSSGIQVQRSSGDPGAGAYIQIRGQSTITGNTQPLIIIDGNPIFNSNINSDPLSPTNSIDGVVEQSRLGDLNPNDIASVEVLKSAAAAGLWGTAAANGVILITTKKGRRSDKVNIAFSSTLSLDKLNKSVPLQTNYGQGTGGRYNGTSSSSWGDKIADRAGTPDVGTTTGEYVLLSDGTKRYPLANGTAANVHGGKTSKQVYDHGRDLFRTGAYYDNNISFSGGDDKSTFYASIANLTQKGIAKAGSDYDRWAFRLNVDRRFGDKFKLTAGLAYSNVNSNRLQQGSNLNGLFLGGLRTSPDFNGEIYEGTYVNAAGVAFANRQVSYRNPIGKGTTSGYDNPFWIMNRIKSNSIVDRFTPNMEASLNLTKNLALIERAGIDYYLDGRTDFFPALSSGGNNGGKYTNQTITERQFTNSVLLRFNSDLSKDLSLDLVVGHNYNSQYYSNIGTTVRNFILPDAPANLANSPSTSRVPFNEFTRTRKSAFLAQASFAYAGMLFLDLTGRNEEATTYAGTNFFPSASLAWQFTKLGGLENSKFLTFGKLRGSYGKVGVEPGAYLSQTYFLPLTEVEGWGGGLDAASDTYGGGYSRSFRQGSPTIKPEIKTEYEVGTDLRFGGNKVSLGFTYYQNKTTGAIFSVQVPSSTGFDNTWANAGELQNKGVEADLGLQLYKKNDFTVSTNFIFSKNTNKVISLNGTKSIFLNGFTGSSSRAVEGYSVGTLWGEDFERDSKGALVLNADGFPTGKAANELVIGNSNPEWTGSAGINIGYKGISVSALFEHVQGGDIWNGTRGALNVFGKPAAIGNETVYTTDLKTATGSTITAGTPFRGNIGDFGAGPVALTETWYNNLGGGFNGPGKQFIEEGTRTRLREVAIGYSLNGDRFKAKTHLQSIDFSISGRNLALWTKYSGIDPETNLSGPTNGRGLDYFNNPSTRSYFFTIRINY
ncbi:MAG: SusC/RagA family TonB-linked outer membrane protein [Ferruginibacter sp.]